MAAVGNNQSAPLLQQSVQAGNEPTSFPFNEIIAELQMMILNEMDYPTKSSLGMTCKSWLHLNGDFNPYTFADQCAKLGHHLLLAYSRQMGGPFDLRTATIAAEHGQIEFLEMFLEREAPQIQWRSRSEIERVFAESAARHGQQKVLDWLKVEEWKSEKSFMVLAGAAAKGGNAALARHFATKTQALGGQPHNEQLIKDFAENDFLEEALQFRASAPIERSISHESFCHKVFTAGRHYFKPHLMQWALENDPTSTLLRYQPDTSAVHWICEFGALPMLKFATAHGAQLDTKCIEYILVGRFFKEESAFFECLQFVHEQLPPFSKLGMQVNKLPPWATRESMQWMLDQGYRFSRETNLENYLDNHLADFQIAHRRDQEMSFKKLDLDLGLITWILNQGARATLDAFVKAACTCNLNLLNFLWERDPDTFRPSDPLIPRFFSHMLSILETYIAKNTKVVRLTPLKKTVQWLLDKGYTWGDDLKPYTDFLQRVHRLSPKRKELLLSFAQDLQMPPEVIVSLAAK